MKNAIILHGTGTLNTEFWFPYIKEKLEEKGYEVWLPQLPNEDIPNLEEWLPFVLNDGKFNEETILIGHSAGSQLILSILEKLNIKIHKAILVSGYAQSLRESASSENKPELNWNKIKEHAEEFIFINSDNDPWGCDDTQGKIMQEKLGGELILPKGEGHMGSTTYNQPYKEFPLLAELL
ncbi:MAG: putative Alpha/beta fold family hydrolase [Candidatus Nomurabacteria bacterium]|nr:putative Alpha/beta fold family hydrolase [Candidatus Nomurabacteria bacterium]